MFFGKIGPVEGDGKVKHDKRKPRRKGKRKFYWAPKMLEPGSWFVLRGVKPEELSKNSKTRKSWKTNSWKTESRGMALI